MKFSRIIVVFFVCLFLFTSCKSKIIPLSKTYYDNTNKVGVLFIADSIRAEIIGDQSLLEMALTGTKRFRAPLELVDKAINPISDIENTYFNTYQEKGKPIKKIDYKLNTEDLVEFEKPKKSKKQYFNYDLRFLQSKDIDELLIVTIEYGLLVNYDGIFEEEKLGNCRIESKIINLKDNSILYNNFTVFNVEVIGNWKTPPNYPNLKNAIQLAIKQAIEEEKRKFNN